ncbi:Mannosyl-D-glycerate transport/metabolism system repressor MngR [Kordia antarctica]|uniref:Mannosyl-D-glycerate transport/metabolism system repressor MngR n=1 Tax=Kordia antarctica TaxID=1218801 RepID=A0A7L4ZRG7_9FLAO|nr:GntR family transcriptional regulator [Kordia antarctica]QHI39212.1 Mannosyl-D-glycerate transport/metabolism system repressor MngR [Kordia antarctica]
MSLITVSKKSSIPKYKQIVASIEKAISSGELRKGDKLPSLNSVKDKFSLSRDTVLMAFNELKTRGIVQSIVGKGYYVLNEDIDVVKKVFLLFDELNSFKEDLYNSFLNALGTNVQVDIFFHHFNFEVFSKLIHDHNGNYSHYIIMPANLNSTNSVICHLPSDKVYILDQLHEDLIGYPSVVQNFKKDMFNGLEAGNNLIQKYKKINLLFSSKKQPKGILDGFSEFCTQYQYANEVISTLENRTLNSNEIFVILDDKNLIRIIKKAKEQGLVIGKDIGIICYNDTLLKEIVEGGITTISTDFNLMGENLASMMLENQQEHIENPSRLIIRKSV